MVALVGEGCSSCTVLGLCLDLSTSPVPVKRDWKGAAVGNCGVSTTPLAENGEYKSWIRCHLADWFSTASSGQLKCLASEA